MEEPPREREISSEPCSGRSNPFDDIAEPPSRKRQRVSHGGSRSRSVDTARNSDIVPDSVLRRQSSARAQPDSTPSTPTRKSVEPPAEPTSSRVTLNLRLSRPPESIPSSPLSPSPMTSKLYQGVDATRTKVNADSENDAISTIPAIEAPSSSPSIISSPQVELLQMEDSDVPDSDSAVALINDDDDEAAIYENIFSKFPYLADGESLVNTVARLTRFLQFDEVTTDEAFCKVRDWVDSYLLTCTDTEILYEDFRSHGEFWHTLPEIIWSLSHRHKYFGDFLRRSREGRKALTQMLCQFARLSGRFIAMDVRTLFYHVQKKIEQEPDLGSRHYLSALSHLLRKEEAPHIGKNLEVHYQWNFEEDIIQLLDSFQTEGGTIATLTKLAEGQLLVLPPTLKNFEVFTPVCRITEILVRSANAILDDKENIHEHIVLATEQKIMQGYDFFRVMSSGLENVVDKHVTSLSPDAAAAHLQCLTYILRCVLTIDSTISRDILEDCVPAMAMIPLHQHPMVVSYEWKFGILKKLITSAQMQLRVIGVTTMCTDLLHLHSSSKTMDIPTCPFLIYFANYILEHKLVDYIVGIGSHPEIINESSNILGFLIVTKTYRRQQTDKIWQTVMTSQDPRVVEAIQRMLIRCLHLFDSEPLMYLCGKLSDVPLEAFTPAMRELCNGIFKELMQKAASEGTHLNSPPYLLCVRLICESSIVSVDSPAGQPDIQQWAATRFRDLIAVGPPIECRREIYEDCIKDISSKTPTAPGSICVVNILVQQNISPEIGELTTKYGLTKLLVEELESVIVDEHSSFQSLRSTPASQASRALLLRIIVSEPGTITAGLGKRLWDALVGNDSRSAMERNIWWQTLNLAVKQSPPGNIFLSTCFEKYLPALAPHCFTPGALEFAREAVLCWMDDVRDDFVEGDVKFESHAVEQIWRMILTAPPNTIDGAAIGILVETYVQSELILSAPPTKARSVYLALVHRCLNQLKGAASRLKSFSNQAHIRSDKEMAMVASDGQFQEQEKIFTRSLAVLREFLRAYHSKLQFASPRVRHVIPEATPEILEGEPVTVKYQSFDGDIHTEVKSLILGRLNTAASLLATLQKATGFKNYKVYCGGREFDPDENEICKSLVDLNLNGLFLVKRREDAEGSDGQSTNDRMTLEIEIIKHFDDLWSYLSMHEKVAQEIYYFLKTFPVYDQLLKSFASDTPHTQIFPVGQPFKSLYAIHALREYIGVSSSRGNVDEATFTRAVSLIVAAISDPVALDDCANGDLKDALALHFIDCLVQLLKEPVFPASTSTLLDDALLKRLLHLMSDAKKSHAPKSTHLTGRSFEAMIECSIHSSQFWESFLSCLRDSNLLRELILDDLRPLVRKGTAKQITDRCNQYATSLSPVSSTNFVMALWPLVSSLIPDAMLQPRQCETVLSIAYVLFKRISETSIDSLRLDDLVNQWGGLLLSHTSSEFVGQPDSVDMAAQGVASLLHYATSVAKAAQQPVCGSHIGTQLFRKHLFPDIYGLGDGAMEPKLPVMNPKTRILLAETVFSLVKDDEIQYRQVLSYMDSLVPYVDISDGSPYSYELGFQFERVKSIRSNTGYVGLRNLSNTCYLNSLFTQLFMNLPFRQFMLQAHLADGGSSQKLLAETQSLFSYMQNSFKRFVDPADLASSIRTYEETQIDVTVQMDVDEFYNLLFDRWESQILAPDAKRIFRSFYGGQLVQQVKSKECPHVSERLEPFSAIQCDIKGKSSLQESLQAYVDGEVMEGENKYKCSTCDKHVDAVKRACLEEIPDNLIFHLKRFDFNLRTLQRSKINDHFSFPNKIDMKPYKVEHLMDSPVETPEDIFELVGILVHSGTAESGHYYSYIRERPSNSHQDNWVEFNDECVSPWDPNFMEGSCFGGPDYRGQVDSGSMLYDKSWSAYMLFYQRCSDVAAQKQRLDRSGMPCPVRLPVPRRLSSRISMENQVLMRKFCLYDPSHSSFTFKMLQNMKQINGGNCSQLHHLEKRTLRVTFNHLDQVVARTKDIPEFPNFMMQLGQLFRTCAECSRDYLEWLCDCPEALRQLLIKNPDQMVRNDIASSILQALNKVKSDAPYAYGLESEDSEDEQETGQPDLLRRISTALNCLWDIFHTSFRAWPEYFGLLTSIAKMGRCEAAVLLSAGYLRKTLEIITADPQLPTTAQYSKMLTIIAKRMATRPVAYEAVISLLWNLMRVCDISQEPIFDFEDRAEYAVNGEPIPYTESERGMFIQYWTRSHANIVMDKLLHIHQNDRATGSILIELLSWEHPLDSQLYHAIIGGIKRGMSTCSSRPFLLAALAYCEHSRNPKGLESMVAHVAKVALHLDNSDGKDFMQFFKDVWMLTKTHSDMSTEELFEFLLNQVAVWAPGMLTYYDLAVRVQAEEFFQDLLLSPLENSPNVAPHSPVDGDYNDDYFVKVQLLRRAVRKLAMSCLDYLHETYIRQRQNAVRATLLNIESVVNACDEAFDRDDALTNRFREHRNSVLVAMKKYTVEEADEEASDWGDNSDGDYDGSSEPIDSIAELGGGTLDDEINL